MIGFVEVWSSGGLSIRGGESKSENSWLIFRFMSSIFSSSSPLVGLDASRWVSGLVRMIYVVQCVTNSAILSGFLSKVEVTVANIFGFWSTWPGWETGSRDPPTLKRGDLVESFYTMVNIARNFLM